MKFFSYFLFLCCSPAWAGLHLGLGTAVAKQAASFIPPSVAVASSTPTSSCSDFPFSVPMIDLSIPFHIEPLGHLAPTPHTFPTDHTYFQINKSSSDIPSFDIHAPTKITIQTIYSTTLLNTNPPFTDYGVDFSPCSGILGRLGHVREFPTAIASAIGTLTDCTTANGIQSCSKVVSIQVEAGEIIGIQHGLLGNTLYGLDFGLYDFNRPALPFLGSEHRSDFQNHVVCPYEYFEDPIRTNLEGRFSSYDGNPRTLPPLCGTAMQDVLGTAQGNWYQTGTPPTLATDESNDIALVHDNIVPSTAVFSVGAGVSASGLPSGLYHVYSPQSSGFVNRDFTGVTADGNVYCYDSFANFSPPNVILIKMPTSSTLLIERQNLADCSGGPWTLTTNATEFER